jgi:hypothetical protein
MRGGVRQSRQVEPLLVHLASYLNGCNRPIRQIHLKVVEPRWSTRPVGSPQRTQERRETIARPRLVRVKVLRLRHGSAWYGSSMTASPSTHSE